MISGNRDVAQPPAARTRNPSEAFQLYDLASLRQTDKVILEAAGDSEAMPSRAQHEFKETSSPTLFTPVVETPVYSDWRREPELSRQASETSLAARGTSALHQNASARSSTALLPRLASKTFFSSNSSKPYHPALITFRGRTMVGDDGFKLANLAFGMFLMGWADASNGAQLPFIQESFRLEYLEVATMFVANFFGWVLSAGINPYLTDRLGLGKTLVIGSCIQMGAFVVLSSAPPFAVVDIAFVMVGLGIGIVNASSTAWTANQKKPHLKLGFVLATYGLGALLAPIAAGFLNKAGVIWSRFYLASLGLAVTNTVLLLASFRLESEESWIRRKNHHKEQRDRQQKNEQRSKRTSEENEAIAAEDGSAVGNDNNSLAASSAPTLSHRKPSIAQRTGDLRDQWPSKHELQSRDRDAIDEEEIRIESAPSTRPASPVREIDASAHEVPYPSTSSKFKALRSMKVVWIFSIFAFANTGTEVSIGGWTSSYLRERGSGHEAEWIVSAFWAGLMVARAVLIPVSAWIGEQRAIYIYVSVIQTMKMAESKQNSDDTEMIFRITPNSWAAGWHSSSSFGSYRISSRRL